MAFEDYVNVICDQLEIIRKEISIHRLTGDAPREMLIGPMWSLKKWEVLNAIDAELERRNVFQEIRHVKTA
jgi:radical SAM superfamily enzyme